MWQSGGRENPSLCLVMSARGFVLLWFRINGEKSVIDLVSTLLKCLSMSRVREEACWYWPAEGRQCQRRQSWYGLICSDRLDGSHCYMVAKVG